MASLASRYAAGEHEQVWREINAEDLPLEERYALRGVPSEADVEDVMRQTFERVARNVDRLIERLPELGYRFESEAGRYAVPLPPRRPCGDHCVKAKASVEDRLDDPVFDDAWPLALSVFGDVVGIVDLRQRYPATEFTEKETRQLISDTQKELPDSALEGWPEGNQLTGFAESLSAVIEENRNPERDAQRDRAEAQDRAPHPFADDPVISRLGDWYPLEVSLDYLAYELTEDEQDVTPLKDGGIALVGEFAASFEHKANFSGAENPWFAFPSNRVDPIVHAEGIRVPFSTYLRRMFARGGFYGTPRPLTRDQDINLLEVEPGIWLPDHPVFTDLAAMMEPF